RGLRFRLTAFYALFFAMLLIGVAALFRQRLENVQSIEVQDMLEEEWKAMKGYARIELNREAGKYFVSWYYDSEDPDETTIVLDLKKIYVITDADGNIIPNATTQEPEVSTTYEDIGVDRAAIRAQVRETLASQKNKIFLRERRDSSGERFLIRS